MDTLKKIQNTMKSFEGRKKVLEHDPELDLAGYCNAASYLEHEFYYAIKRILENDEKDKENISSVQLAIRFGLIDNKD